MFITSRNTLSWFYNNMMIFLHDIVDLIIDNACEFLCLQNLFDSGLPGDSDCDVDGSWVGWLSSGSGAEAEGWTGSVQGCLGFDGLKLSCWCGLESGRLRLWSGAVEVFSMACCLELCYEFQYLFCCIRGMCGLVLAPLLWVIAFHTIFQLFHPWSLSSLIHQSWWFFWIWGYSTLW